MSTFKNIAAATFFAGVVGTNLPENANLGNTANAEIASYTENKVGLVNKNWSDFQMGCQKEGVMLLAVNGANTMSIILKERSILLPENAVFTSFSSGMGIGRVEDVVRKFQNGNYKQIYVLTQKGSQLEHNEIARELWGELPGVEVVVLKGGIEDVVVDSEELKENNLEKKG